MFGYINGYDFYNMKAEKYYAPTKNQNIQELVKNAIFSGDYIGSRKVDGHWYMIIKDEDGNLIFRGRTESVNGGYHNKINYVPHLKEQFEKLPNGSVFLGELHFAKKEGSRNVTTIMGCLEEKAVARQEKEEKLSFYSFDCLAWNGELLFDKRLSQRIKYLSCISQLCDTTYLPLAIYYSGEKLLEFISYCRAKDWEGVVLQRTDGVYEPGKRPARKSIKVKKEIEECIDCFLTGNYKPATWHYTGKDIDNWEYWFNLKNNQKLKGKYYTDFLNGATIEPITKGAYNDWAGAVEIAIYKDNKIIPIGWISNVTEEVKNGIIHENNKWKFKVAKVTAMMIEIDSGALRHGKILEWREDKNWKECDGHEFK